MHEEVNNIVGLFKKHFRNELTAQETEAFEQWLSESDENRKLLAAFTDDDAMIALIRRYARSVRPRMWEKIRT